MFWKRKKNPDNAPPSPQEHLRTAQAALAQGDHRHAVQHLAASLEDNPLDQEALALLRRAILAARDPLELAPLSQGETPYQIGAMRAFIHAWRNQLSEAFNLMAQIYQVVPGLPYLPWVAEWVNRPEAAELERSEALALLLASISAKYNPRFTGPERPLLERILDGVELYRSTHPDAVWVDTAMVTYIRKLGDVGRALALARLIHARQPATYTAIVLATTLREYGDVRGSLAIFRQAQGFAPDDVSIMLDTADTYLMLSQLDDAERVYREALEREPDQPWAAPSLLYVRHAREPLGPWAQQLRDFAAANPANSRAAALLDRLSAYLSSLPDPGDATINVLRQVAEAGDADINQLSLSRLEAPSALLALHRWTLERHGHANAAVSIAEIQQPDPRRPSGPVDVVIWKYEGTRPLPTLPPPTTLVAAAVAALAAQPF
ncbi:MAG TPA: tetratricopeptide repeat protein, partial [Herpetosiphonaceae bacterium]